MPSRSMTAPGTWASSSCSASPAAVTETSTRRSSAGSRRRLTSPAASNRLSSGVRVPESSRRRSPRSPTDLRSEPDQRADRKSGVWGKGGSGRVGVGRRRYIENNKQENNIVDKKQKK